MLLKVFFMKKRCVSVHKYFFSEKSLFSNLLLGVTHTMVVFKTETTTINNFKKIEYES